MTHVALLRAINVGGRNKVSMSQLKDALESRGFSCVSTYIASGNVIFRTDDTARLASRIEAALEQEIGFPIAVVVRDLQNMRNLSESIPSEWLDDKGIKCDVMFLNDAIDAPAILEQLPSNPEIEDVRYLPGAVLWRIDRVLVRKSRMLRLAGTPLYQQLTVRNPRTVRRLYELMRRTENECRE
jgi:uncharacterized protein (DUF1697 family)